MTKRVDIADYIQQVIETHPEFEIENAQICYQFGCSTKTLHRRLSEMQTAGIIAFKSKYGGRIQVTRRTNTVQFGQTLSDSSVQFGQSGQSNLDNLDSWTMHCPTVLSNLDNVVSQNNKFPKTGNSILPNISMEMDEKSIKEVPDSFKNAYRKWLLEDAQHQSLDEFDANLQMWINKFGLYCPYYYTLLYCRSNTVYTNNILTYTLSRLFFIGVQNSILPNPKLEQNLLAPEMPEPQPYTPPLPPRECDIVEEYNYTSEFLNLLDADYPQSMPAAKPKAERKKRDKDEYDPGFMEFYNLSPNKERKSDAHKLWVAMQKEKLPMEKAKEAYAAYMAQCKQKGTEPQYMKRPFTFLKDLRENPEKFTTFEQPSENKPSAFEERLAKMSVEDRGFIESFAR